MRSLKVEAWCDYCWQDDEAKVEAVHAFVVGALESETTRPEIRFLETCEVHAKPVLDLIAVLGDAAPFNVEATARTPVAAKKAPAAALAPAPGDWQCPVCHLWLVSNPVAHIYNKHRPDPKPPQPATCPECGEARVGAGMGSHRRSAHGFDAVADALSGVPGYRQPRKGAPR